MISSGIGGIGGNSSLVRLGARRAVSSRPVTTGGGGAYAGRPKGGGTGAIEAGGP